MNETTNLPGQEIDRILERFLHDDLTLEETEQAIRELHQTGQDVVTRLLSMLDDPRPEQQTIATVLLAAVGDERLVPLLLERVHDPDVSDVCKIKLITTILQLTPHADAKELFSHLHDYRHALEAARREHLLLLQSPQDLTLWLESVQSEMSALSRRQLIENSIELGDPAAVPMLICLCYDADEQVALTAMDAVERFKDVRALRPLEELSVHHPLETVRKEAAKTADRLRIRAALAASQPASMVGPLYACYLTAVDGAGSQIAFFLRHQGHTSTAHTESAHLSSSAPATQLEDTFTIISTIFDDAEGIKDCFGFGADTDEVEELLQDYVAHGVVPIQVSHQQCLAALDEAVEINWQHAHLPMSFLAWREWIEQGRVQAQDLAEPLVVPDDKRALRLAECGNLLLQDEFQFWFFPPELLQDLEARYRQQSRRHGALDRASLGALLRDGVHLLVDEQMRQQLGRRLRRMTPLLQALYEEEEVWQWAAVAADALAADSSLPVEEHPFLLSMLACTLEDVLGMSVGWFDAA